MKRPALLALALTAAACGSAGVRVGTEAPAAVVIAPPPEPVPVPAPPAPPAGAVAVWYADTTCPPIVQSITLPDPEVAACVLHEARQAAVRIVLRDHTTPGNASPCWAFFGQMYANCLDVAARKLPAVSYGHSGRRIEGLLNGKPWNGCAAGISGDPIFVSLAQPARIWGLHGWEAANEFIWHTMDRADITDGPIVSESTSAALAACGVQ